MKKKIVRSSGACRVLYGGALAIVLAPRSANHHPANPACGICHAALDLDPATAAVAKKLGIGGNAFCHSCSPSSI